MLSQMEQVFHTMHKNNYLYFSCSNKEQKMSAISKIEFLLTILSIYYKIKLVFSSCCTSTRTTADTPITINNQTLVITPSTEELQEKKEHIVSTVDIKTITKKPKSK